MKSSSKIKTKNQKSTISTIVPERKQKYINKNISKKYVYKKEKAADTDKVLQNNKLSKNFIFSPIHTKQKDSNNIKSELRRPLDIREDVNIDYEKYQQQTIHNKNPSLDNLNFLNNNNYIPTSPIINTLNQSYYLLDRNNNFMLNSNRSVDNLIINKWKCTQCGNVNSNFNYLCNNCNMPNTLLTNDTININTRNNSTGKNIKSLNIDNNNIYKKSISNNTIMKKQILKKYNTKNNINNNDIGFNTIRTNKNDSNYFYNEPNNISNFYETNRDNNITHLYSYGNYLANELKTSNDAHIKLIENYQNNENEYKNIYEQNDLIKKKIKILKEKENQLDKINEQLQKSLQFITKKFGYKNNKINIFIENEQKNIEELNTKINKYNEENEILNKKLKENNEIIIKMKAKIEELSEKKNDSINIKLKEKIEDIIEVKNNIEKYIKELKEKN